MMSAVSLFPRTPIEDQALLIETGAPVTGIVTDTDTFISSHGDGTLRILREGQPPRTIQTHRGAVLSLCVDREPGAVLSGGDDGQLIRTTLDGSSTCLATFGRDWIDHVDASRASGVRACSAGRQVHVWRQGARAPDVLDHPSTVGGLAIDTRGRRIAAAHYGGVTVHERGKRGYRPIKLAFQGSHLGVTFSPDGRFVISSMQENMLRGWRLADRTDLRMAGYPTKVHSLRWVGTLPWLATTGAGFAVCWPFDGRDGPMDRPPLTVAEGRGQIATSVTGIAGADLVFTGFEDGAVLFAELRRDGEDYAVRGSTGSAVSALEVSPDLRWLLVGDEAGLLCHIPLRAARRSQD